MDEFWIHQWEQLSSLWRKNQDSETGETSFDPEMRSLLREQFGIRQAMNGLKQRHYDVEKGWRRVRSRSLRHYMLRVAKYAAVIFLIFSIVYLLVPSTGKEKTLALLGDTIVPGMPKAELVLATGERLFLNVHQEVNSMESKGVQIMNDTIQGKVQYRAMGDASEDSLAFNTLFVPKGGEYSLELPDGSVVWINSESSLRFPEKFGKSRREVYLDGEAFFKIAKNAEKPFHVHVGTSDIRVLGTQFNVSAYATDRVWHTTLVEGSVLVTCGTDRVLMKPTEQYRVNRETGETDLKLVQTELYTSWVDGKFYFKAYAFEELVKKLERWYDFKMFYVDERIKYRRFSGVVNKHQPLQEMLKFLEMTTDVQFKVVGNVVTASRVY